MTITDIQNKDLKKELLILSDNMLNPSKHKYDIKKIENNILKAIGILDLLYRLKFNDSTIRRIMTNTLTHLYKIKRELNKGNDLELLEELVV